MGDNQHREEVERIMRDIDNDKRAVLKSRVKNDFVYHEPSEDRTHSFEVLRRTALIMAQSIVAHCPPGREAENALTRLEECVMHANAGIARSGHVVYNGTSD